MSLQPLHIENFEVRSPKVTYSDEYIESVYDYQTTEVVKEGGKTIAVPKSVEYQFRTVRTKPKLGLMLIGWGGNNGSTTTASIIANKMSMSWQTKNGPKHANYFGSLTQASTCRVGGHGPNCVDTFVPFSAMLPMVHPNDIVVGGWDISSMNLADSMRRSKVLDYTLQEQLRPHMQHMVPLPSVYYPDFIAANQSERADNVIPGQDKQVHLEHIRKDIREFKKQHGLDKVVVLWTGNTERFASVQSGVNDTSDNLLAAIAANEPEIAPSTIFAVASILEGCTYINGSPQNTFVPGVIELAEQKDVMIGGDDFKSGQTKMKSVMVDFLVSAGIKPTAIVSYNHLGNNDGKNLSAPQTFRSKEISKSNVVDDMVLSNRILYKQHEHPDHVVVIKYVPTVADSKRAMDEYTSEIFMGGTNTIAMHNTCVVPPMPRPFFNGIAARACRRTQTHANACIRTHAHARTPCRCEDSLLATPLILDLCILADMVSRIQYKTSAMSEWSSFHPIMSILSYLIKAHACP